MGIKNPKGAVSVETFKGRLRLRWRYQTKRFSFVLTYYSPTNLLLARKTALQIEHDILTDCFDSTSIARKIIQSIS